MHVVVVGQFTSLNEPPVELSEAMTDDCDQVHEIPEFTPTEKIA
jgi:hypothetical protein